jgi:cell wall-associated NlpC family hydrolase
MSCSTSMGLYRMSSWRSLGLAVAGSAVALLALWPGPTATAAVSNPVVSNAVTTTTTSLPAVPAVPLSITDGQSAQTLLSNAVTLASVGLDTTALRAGIAATQRQLDQDAATARDMTLAAKQADQRAAAAVAQAQRSQQGFHSLDNAVKNAVVFLYTDGPSTLTVNPSAGDKLAYAIDYADTAISPNGILATRAYDAKAEHQALAAAKKAQKTADRAAAKAAKALAAEASAEHRLDAQLSSISAASATAIETDHTSLAAQAATELLSATALQFTPKAAIPAPLSTTPVALAWAFAELGKPYVWAATGPNSFDCSGLTQYVWRQAGVSIPRVAADQDTWTVPVPLSQLLPGDLVFYGKTDIHHVGIYIGDGLMINAPHTGDVVRVTSIWWSDLAGFGRVHAPGTPVPLHQPPSLTQPAAPVVVPSAGPVPSQTKPPKGWKPKPGSSTPFKVYTGPITSGSPASTTTTTLPPPSTTTQPATTSTTVPCAPTTSTTSTTSTSSTTTSSTTTSSTTTTVPTTTTTTPCAAP